MQQERAGRPANGRAHEQEGQRIRPESCRVRVARQPHARRGEPVRLGRRASQPGSVFRSRTSPRRPCPGRRRAGRKDRARQRDADARQHEHLGVAPADRADGRVRRASGDRPCVVAIGRSRSMRRTSKCSLPPVRASSCDWLSNDWRTIPRFGSRGSAAAKPRDSSMVRQTCVVSRLRSDRRSLSLEPAPLRGQSDLVIPSAN